MDRRTGAERIADERRRQVEDDGYDQDHDLGVGATHLVRAAEAYASSAQGFDRQARHQWPWDPDAFHPTGDLVRDLEKAGALIAAAIDVALAVRAEPTFDTIPDPGLEYEARFETADDGGEL